MSNTDQSGLNHTTATLIVDCGGHKQEIDLFDYPSVYDLSESGDVQRIGTPMPTRIKIETTGATCMGESYNLFTDDDIDMRAKFLKERIYTVLQASVVNEKQRKALEDIVESYFQDFTMSLYRLA